MCLFYKQFVFVFAGLCSLQHEVPGLPKHKIYTVKPNKLWNRKATFRIEL